MRHFAVGSATGSIYCRACPIDYEVAAVVGGLQKHGILHASMFLRCHLRKKDGKQHRYYSVEESRRLQSGKVVQRHVLYLGEINRRSVLPRGISAGGEAAPSGALCERLHRLGPIHGDAVLPSGPRRFPAGSLHGLGRL